MLLGMAFTMSVPMAAWMRYRGHGWAPVWEMTASMFVPSFAAIGLLWAGTVEGADALLLIQHIGMFPSMLAVMLFRLAEYTGHGRVHGRARARRALERHPSAEGIKTIGEGAQASATALRGAADTVVGDRDLGPVLTTAHRHPRCARVRVLGHVRERLGRDEVEGSLMRRREAVVERRIDHRGHRRASGEFLEGGA